MSSEGPGGSRGCKGVQKNTKKPEKRSRGIWLQQHPGFCAGGSSRTNGSGYPLAVPAVAHPPPQFQGVRRGQRGRLNL